MLLALGLACAGASVPETGIRVLTQSSEEGPERHCAWYADTREGVLYAGESAFWSASTGASGLRGSDPRGDLRHSGPVRIGRFDLATERWLEALDVGGTAAPAGGWRSGVWDVLAHENGRIYFTTFFEPAGYVEIASGQVRRLPQLGPGLNELYRGPGASLLVSRYGGAEAGANGGIVQLDPDGGLLAEYRLEAPSGFVSAPKSVAWDPVRREIWVTTDLLPTRGGATAHDAYVLDEHGVELRRVAEPEIQFVVFAADGTGYWAESEEGALWLRIASPGGDERRVLLDPAFPSEMDFAQEIRVAPDGSALVTRWSGWLHAVDRAGVVRRRRLPRLADDGLYYTAVRSGERICATHCGDVTVVCLDR